MVELPIDSIVGMGLSNLYLFTGYPLRSLTLVAFDEVDNLGSTALTVD